MSMFYVTTKLFQQKSTFYMVYVKMTKFGTKMGHFVMHVFVFLHRTQRIYVFSQNFA
jgi:CDP-diacylglycerol pyrophosphatase